MKNPIRRYQIAVMILLSALLTVGIAYQRQTVKLHTAQKDATEARKESAYYINDGDRVLRLIANLSYDLNRLRGIERGTIIPNATRRAIARQVAKGGNILDLKSNGEPTPLVKVSLPDAKARASIIGWGGPSCGNVPAFQDSTQAGPVGREP